MIKTILRFLFSLILIPSSSMANANNREDIHTQIVTLTASLVATLEACAPKYPQFAPYAANPQSFIRLSVRNDDEADYMLKTMASEDYRKVLVLWRESITKSSAARELDSECKALSNILANSKK